MQGEYRVPGGKLVVVDLEGAPADTDTAGLTARIHAALPPSAGSSTPSPG